MARMNRSPKCGTIKKNGETCIRKAKSEYNGRCGSHRDRSKDAPPPGKFGTCTETKKDGTPCLSNAGISASLK